MWTGGAGDWMPNPMMSGWSILPSQPQPLVFGFWMNTYFTFWSTLRTKIFLISANGLHGEIWFFHMVTKYVCQNFSVFSVSQWEFNVFMSLFCHLWFVVFSFQCLMNICWIQMLVSVRIFGLTFASSLWLKNSLLSELPDSNTINKNIQQNLVRNV